MGKVSLADVKKPDQVPQRKVKQVYGVTSLGLPR
jgi:hypothetical protein